MTTNQMTVGFTLVLAGGVMLYVANKSLAAADTAGSQSSAASSGIAPSGDKQQTVAAAAAKYGIPSGILWGVYGVETSHGSDVTTSSAGAMGSFQFIQSTAAQYHYPYTNATDPQTFAAQADAAAHLLSDLFHQTGSWDAALHSYSGGGYGLSGAQAQAQGLPTS